MSPDNAGTVETADQEKKMIWENDAEKFLQLHSTAKKDRSPQKYSQSHVVQSHFKDRAGI